jgi:hypothetical protein
MTDRRHLRRDEDADKEPSPPPGRERRENPETASILDLQGSVGNRAVAALLVSREADAALAPLQRQPADQAPGAEPANDGKTSATGTMTIPEMDLVMPILSFQQQVGRTRQPKDSSGEVFVAIALESLDPRIQEAAAKGEHFDTITVAIGPKSTFTLHSVVFSSFNVGSNTATLSLNFTSMEFSPGG